jgi:SAM-dependent methyltransferase
LVSAHFGAVAPPQSTSVSSRFFTPSTCDGIGVPLDVAPLEPPPLEPPELEPEEVELALPLLVDASPDEPPSSSPPQPVSAIGKSARAVMQDVLVMRIPEEYYFSSALMHRRPSKPPLRIQPTTLWEYPSQHYGDEEQGDRRYVGATPSYVVWNLIQRYTKPGDLVVDPFCGSGTTLDVAKDSGRQARGFDIAPYRADIERADARSLPIEPATVKLVFMDPPYGDHIQYSDDPDCIGKLSAYDPAYYKAMHRAIREAARVLVPGGTLGVYVCDYFEKKHGFAPVGFQLFVSIAEALAIVDIVSVVRHNKSLEMGNYRRAAEEGNFFLRGFNYLFIAQKPPAQARSEDRRPRRGRR